MSEQNLDGSWTPIFDVNVNLGELSASVMNYFALKAMGVSPNSKEMLLARDYIIKNGGIESSNLITKVFLALFDNYPWKNLPKIPLFFFENSPVKLVGTVNSFAQWIGPNIMPIAYLKKYQIHKNLGKAYDLRELFVRDPQIENKDIPIEEDHHIAQDVMAKILKNQKKRGSFGAYIPATFFSYICMIHFEKTFKERDFTKEKEMAMSYLKNLIIRKGEMSTLGIVDDGHIWDTALISLGLLRSQYPAKELKSAGDYLVTTATPEGGYPFGYDFEEYPDTDDTAMVIMSLAEIGGYDEQNDKAAEWLLSMQSKDGGWGAFAKNNTGNFIMRAFAKDFQDSADLFDESSPDVTGHVLEALGRIGYNKENSIHVRKAIAYLKKQVKDFPAWTGRWGVNYIYGTGAVLAGLSSVQENMSEEYIMKARKWLINSQNNDGGFGETTFSYINPQYAGKGVSTTSQTAWGLMGLLKTGDKKDPGVTKAVEYLVREFNSEKGWHDRSTVGTGHPKIIYMDYPSYPVAFPMISLGEYLKDEGK